MATTRAKRIYTDEDRAYIYSALEINKGNIARTSRETGIPKQTIRQWRDKWAADGPPEEVEALVGEVVNDQISRMTRVRDQALDLIERKLTSEDIKNHRLEKLATVFGILDDKIRLANGLATSRSETVHALPSPGEMKELFSSMVRGAIEAQEQRQGEIVAAGVEQAPKALPAGTDKE